jgi:4-oxalocrotonate tautomerase
MPTIRVELFAGRTVEQKRALAQALTEATVRTLGGSPGSVDVIFTDVQRHDWATAGTLWCDPPHAAPTPVPDPATEGGRFTGTLGPNLGGTPD